MNEMKHVKKRWFPVWGWYVLGGLLFILVGYGIYRWVTPPSNPVVVETSPSPSPSVSPSAAVTDPVTPSPFPSPSASPTASSEALQKADTAYLAKNYTEAIAQYKIALDQDSTTNGQASIWNKLGNAYRDSDKRTEALASYATAYRLDPHLIAAYQNRANLYVAMSDKESAKKVLQDGLDANPNNVDLTRDLSTLQLSGVEE